MRAAAIIPIKRFELAKRRLTDPRRPALIEAMVSDVLDTLAGVADLEATIVVTAEERVPAGPIVIGEPADSSHSAAATAGILHAQTLGIERVLLLPGDCPALSVAEVTTLVRARAAVVVVPDRHGTGTNALALSPPDAIAPSFGPGSRERHVRSAGARGTVLKLPGLLHDVDTREDLRALARLLDGEPLLAPRTRAVLERDGVAAG